VRINVIPSQLLALPTLGLALSLMVSGTALAQSDAQPDPQQFGPRANKVGDAPKVEVIGEHGKWKVQCETTEGPDAKGQLQSIRTCGMVQQTQNEKNPNATLMLVMVKAQVGEKTQFNMRVIAPIGVFLPTGVALEVDGEAVGRVPFTRCMPQVCMAFAEASPETLVKLKKGNEANFIIYEAPGISLPMKVSLNGFSAALADLDKN
jgi:invasion protein IalB